MIHYVSFYWTKKYSKVNHLEYLLEKLTYIFIKVVEGLGTL